MKIESKKVDIERSNELVFQYISNLNNFGKTLPSQVKNWQSTEDECSFEIDGMAKITLVVSIKTPNSFVEYSASADKPINLRLSCYIDHMGENQCQVYNEIDIDVPIFMAGMVKKPLQNFADQIMDRLKQSCESM